LDQRCFGSWQIEKMNAKEYLSILVIEDNPGDFALVEEFLHEQMKSPRITHVPNYRDARGSLTSAECDFDVILLDLSLPDKTGSDLIQDIVGVCNYAPVIVLTGYADLEFGARSIAQGVSDYVLKDELTSLTLYKTILYSLERRKIIASLEESEKRVRSFARQLSEVIEEERARIAREIHDEFGQQLSGIKMSLSALRNSSGKQINIGPIIDVIVDEVNHTIQSLRKISNELRPALLDKLGLFAAIEWLVNEFTKKTLIESYFEANADQPVLNKDIEINIFRICQEALTNISKHAEATKVTIEITTEDDNLIIKIADNGKGINIGALHDVLSSGLLNMRERASLIGADIDITSQINNGTTITLIINNNGEENINS
jgi:signal transduction histidine kinase